MLIFRKNIAILLAAILVFPIGFQSFHVLSHHSGKHQEYHEHDARGTRLPAQEMMLIVMYKVQDHEHCPVCEFQFSVNDLPKVSVFRVLAPRISRLYTEKATRQANNQDFPVKSPRAPPVITC